MINPIALTQGDAAGIGPEIIAKSYRADPALMQGCFVAGDVMTMRRAAKVEAGANRLPLPVLVLDGVAEAPFAPPNCIPVLQIGSALCAPDEPAIPWGIVNPKAGEFAGRCVVWAAEACMKQEVAAMVTAPINKAALAAAGPEYSQFAGHTEILQFHAAKFTGATLSEMPVRMMLANDELRVVLVSVHLSLREALEAVTITNVMETLRITHYSLLQWLGRPPRIAVAGLNPHAGEGGLFGREEIEILAPAIEAARAQGWSVNGPWPPDTVFMKARQSRHAFQDIDVVVAMYHDQGLVPFKTLAMETGVNFTAGLPFVRTSPDHGTAYNIAGKNQASETSFREALFLAVDIVKIRMNK